MTTSKINAFVKQMLAHPDLRNAHKFVILGLNRDNPGFGDDAVLVDCGTGGLEYFEGEFQQGTRFVKDPEYRRACDEYRENGWASDDGDDDVEYVEDDPYEDCDDWDTGLADRESVVIVPKEAEVFTPGMEIGVLYGSEGDDSEPKESWISDSYRIDVIEVPYGLVFHTNAHMDGIMFDEDFFDYPLICWNTGSHPIKVDGENNVPAGGFLILPSSNPKRRERRRWHKEIMSIPVLANKAEIEENEKRLLELGCPAEDAHILANYYSRIPCEDVEDYDPANHAGLMDKVRWEGRPRPQG